MTTFNSYTDKLVESGDFVPTVSIDMDQVGKTASNASSRGFEISETSETIKFRHIAMNNPPLCIIEVLKKDGEISVKFNVKKGNNRSDDKDGDIHVIPKI